MRQQSFKLSKHNKSKAIGIPAILFLLLTSIFLFAACAKEKEETPEKLSVVIKQLQDNNGTCSCEPYIDQYLWKNKTVYVLAYRGPACNWIPTFYNDGGEVFTLSDGYSFDAFLQEAKRIKEVWRCR